MHSVIQWILQTVVCTLWYWGAGLLAAVQHLFQSALGGVVDTPVLYYKKSESNEALIKRCPGLKRPFHPPWWALNGHIETFATIFTHAKGVSWSREDLLLPDGGTVVIDWLERADGQPFQRENCHVVLIVIPGLVGDVEGYAPVYSVARRHNILPVVFNRRGYGGHKISTPKLQRMGDSSDLRSCTEHVRRKFPDKILAMAGYSAGAGLLLKYLEDYAEDPIVQVAVHNFSGYDCNKVYAHGGVSEPYNTVLTKQMQKKIIEPNAEQLSKVVDLKKVFSASNMRQLEEHLYCRIYGFDDVDDYLLYNNPHKAICKVSIPALSINSRNDPICKEDYIPVSDFLQSEKCILALTNYGGHCAWFGKNGKRWAEELAMEFILAAVSASTID